MSAFKDCADVGAEGRRRVQPILDKWAGGGTVIDVGRGPAGEFMQRTIGDVVITKPDGLSFGVEVKAERRHTGNLFLETWSNKRRGRSRDGWLLTSGAAVLLYGFLDTGQAYAVEMSHLWDWAVDKGNLYKYPELPVPADQKNKTCGHAVPIGVLRDEVPTFVEYQMAL